MGDVIGCIAAAEAVREEIGEFDLFLSDSDFRDDVFPGTSIPADNNTESYRNRDTFWWHVFTGVGDTGSHGCLPPGFVGNASATFRNTISSAFFSSSSC